MKNIQRILRQYDYRLPAELIAQKPARPRDKARLLVYCQSSGKVFFDVFANLGKYLPKKSVLVFNHTRVIPARLEVTKQSGGKARILYLNHTKEYIQALSDRPLPVGKSVFPVQNPKKAISILKKQGNIYFLRTKGAHSGFIGLLHKYGRTPLPPYIKQSPLSERQKRKEYQTVFAKEGASVAAPTASLHFTKKLMAQLKQHGHSILYVNLNVGLGTFAKLTEQNIKQGKLHLESYQISSPTAEFILKAKKQGQPVIAIGTTVVRALETAFGQPTPRLEGTTELFILPGYEFKVLDGLVTNFHVPQSSLLMLVAAFIGREKLLRLYKKAIHKGLKFFSFGDGMIIIP